MRRDRLLKNSIILISSNLITGIFGFIFSIILSRELGAEGMGLYGLVMPIYDLFLCLISGGMVTAISKVAAVYFSKDDFRNLDRSVDVSLLFDCVWALIIVSFVFIHAQYISVYIIKDTRTIHALQVMCPAMLFIALSGVLKGYFYGTSNIKVPAFIDILEKLLRIIVLTTIVTIFSLKDVKNTVTAAYVTLAIGEFISLVFLYIFYKIKKSKYKYNFTMSEDKLQLLFNILVISVPLSLNGFLSTAISTASALIVPRRLVASGIEYSTALSMIGRFKGMSLSIIFFPMTIITSICTVLIPDLSEKMDKKDYWSAENRISQVLKVSLLLGITTTIICLNIPDSLGKLFYGRTDLGSYIKFASFAAPLVFTSASTFGILNGLGKQNIILRNSLIVSLEELILLYVLTGISWINIFGYGVSLIITSITTLILNIYEIKKQCSLNISTYEILIVLFLSILLYFVLSILNNIIPSQMFALKNLSMIAIGFLISLVFILFMIKNKFR
ncbi:stage V sporulation protein B [Clostridiaceae bacterium UIB06]|uniref:Multidrug-efflux transporter n=1 Tax=Clostridium thailandense TaxID=2794346 RepID=A0A949WRQ8_9CLOT|nr:stage V sporulation protein B [Clostridium thailandense]MBV7274310.1 stage V sporulation protein B [Clostridium thailandense]MCH5136210.1 stage V sporulation protein B [Clostridiaceae bacterium UIB06]